MSNAAVLIQVARPALGRFITDLGKDDFQVVENKKTQSIQEFTAESDLPLRLAILIDISRSGEHDDGRPIEYCQPG